MRIIEEGTPERDHIGLAVSHDRLGLLRGCDQTNSAGRNAGLTFHLLGKRNIKARRRCALRLRGDRAGGNVDVVEALGLERAGEQ
jgi:hypothetical protein